MQMSRDFISTRVSRGTYVEVLVQQYLYINYIEVLEVLV